MLSSDSNGRPRTKQTRSIVNVDSLLKRVHAYRKQLRQNPCNAAARTNLGWALLLLATYQAGYESGAAEAEGEEARTPPAEPPAHALLDHGAADLMQDCLHHSLTAVRLSQSPEEQGDARKLERLLQAAAGEHPLSLAQARLGRAADEFVQDIRDAGAGAGGRQASRRTS